MTESSANWLIHNVNIVLEDRVVTGSVIVHKGEIAQIIAQDGEDAAERCDGTV